MAERAHGPRYCILTYRTPQLARADCVFNILSTHYEYAEVELWRLSCEPNCVGPEGLSESSVTNPVSDSSYAYTLAGFYLGA